MVLVKQSARRNKMCVWQTLMQEIPNIDSGIFSLTRNRRIPHALDPITPDQIPT
jgi:hypothetical protein